MNLNRFLLVLILASYANCYGQQNSQKRTLTTAPFQGVKVHSGLQLNLIPSDVNKAVVRGPQSDDVILSMHKQNLHIKIALGSISDTIPTQVNLYHSKRLHEIIGVEGATITAEGPIEQTSIFLRSGSGASLNFNVFAERLDVHATTGGKLALEGKVTNFNLKVVAGGSCEAEKLSTNQIQTRLIGGGYAYVSASELIDAQVVGGSVLRVFGNPKKRIYQKKLGGKLYFEK
jgi:hypothetical protein